MREGAIIELNGKRKSEYFKQFLNLFPTHTGWKMLDHNERDQNDRKTAEIKYLRGTTVIIKRD